VDTSLRSSSNKDEAIGRARRGMVRLLFGRKPIHDRPFGLETQEKLNKAGVLKLPRLAFFSANQLGYFDLVFGRSRN
jgi:hypothetical protein